jgi:tripartite-type tricarboxylate transporter receptor subunit TctC
LAVTTEARSDVLPDTPSLNDFVPGYDVSGWLGVGAPKGTPTDILDKLNKEINAGLGDPKVAARIAELGGRVLPGTPADFVALIAPETEKWAKVVKLSGANRTDQWRLPALDKRGAAQGQGQTEKESRGRR